MFCLASKYQGVHVFQALMDGHFEEYIDWLNSTWKPTMEATKKAGQHISYDHL